MNPTDPQNSITRWTDGVMSGPERATFEAELQSNPQLRAEVEAAKRLGPLLRDHVTLEAAVPHGNFFNSQVQERITELQRAELRAKPTPWALAVLSWLIRRWWATTAVAAVVVTGLVTWRSLGGDDGSQVLGFYAPSSDVKASSYHDSGANAAVLMLDGLPAIPDDHPISGLSADRTVNEPEIATTTLYDAKGGVLLAMAADSAGTPQVLSH